MIYLNYFIVYIAKVINSPIEKCVYFYFKGKAKSKLKSMKNLKVIGITGSYGKTSVKNYLYEYYYVNSIIDGKLNLDYPIDEKLLKEYFTIECKFSICLLE